jgi:hypothetical protein
VTLDFGANAFAGASRFLEISMRPSGAPAFTLLTPRLQITSTPYAVRSLNSSVADVLSSACVGCVTSAQIGSVSGSAVSGTIPVASVPAGSNNYLQNTTSPQAAANFNISGDGTAGGSLSANAVNAITQYNISGSRAFTVSSLSHVFAGECRGGKWHRRQQFVFALENRPRGRDNSLWQIAGSANTASSHSFFGADADRGIRAARATLCSDRARAEIIRQAATTLFRLSMD